MGQAASKWSNHAPAYQALAGAPGASQHQVPDHSQQVVPCNESASGNYDQRRAYYFAFNCICNDHSQQCLGFNQEQYKRFLRIQTQQVPPIDQQFWATPADQQPARAQLVAQDCKSQDGGGIQEMPEDSEAPASDVTDHVDTAQPAPQRVVDGGTSALHPPFDVSSFISCPVARKKSGGGLNLLDPVLKVPQDLVEWWGSGVKGKLKRRSVTEMEKHIGELEEVLKRKEKELETKAGELRRKEEELTTTCPASEELTTKAAAEELTRKAAAEELTRKAAAEELTRKAEEWSRKEEELRKELLKWQQLKTTPLRRGYKDSHAIPPNLVDSVSTLRDSALPGFAKAFTDFLKERDAFENHEALQNLPAKADRRYRNLAVKAYICSRLFAGFENESYLDTLDCVQGARFLPASYQETDFFLQNQDLEQRRQRYLSEYESLDKLITLQGGDLVDALTTQKAASADHAFHLFCCRKLVSIMRSVNSWFNEFENGDYSQDSLLDQLAANTKYSAVLKPFVKLAIRAFLLHRLAFQFQPPARIFRYARGTRFDGAYMENSVPDGDGDSDDDDSVDDRVVGLMLVPGFQVGEIIVKCTVILAPPSNTVG